jgi:hypothetical protein
MHVFRSGAALSRPSPRRFPTDVRDSPVVRRSIEEKKHLWRGAQAPFRSKLRSCHRRALGFMRILGCAGGDTGVSSRREVAPPAQAESRSERRRRGLRLWRFERISGFGGGECGLPSGNPHYAAGPACSLRKQPVVPAAGPRFRIELRLWGWQIRLFDWKRRRSRGGSGLSAGSPLLPLPISSIRPKIATCRRDVLMSARNCGTTGGEPLRFRRILTDRT